MNPEPTNFDGGQMEPKMEATRDSALEAVLTDCEGGVRALEKELAAIQEQLSPVLQPAPSVSTPPEPVEASSPAVDRLRAIGNDIRKSVNHLCRLREHLDL